MFLMLSFPEFFYLYFLSTRAILFLLISFRILTVLSSSYSNIPLHPESSETKFILQYGIFYVLAVGIPAVFKVEFLGEIVDENCPTMMKTIFCNLKTFSDTCTEWGSC